MKLTKPLSELKLFLWLAVLWTAVVTYFCLINFSDLPSVSMKNFDKFGHVTFHFGLTVLWYLYYRFQKAFADKKALTRAVAFSVIYGIAIELIQTFFTTTRSGDILDVCANMTGSALAAIVVFSLRRRYKKPNA